MQSAERVSQIDKSDNYVFQRSQLAYHYAAEMVSGRVLEIGTGSGYGVSIISPRTKTFMTIDKSQPPIDLYQYPNVEYRQMKVPPLNGLQNNSFDFVIMFQVIEHIERDFDMLREIERVLRPGGKLIISTPNRKMSITRNPWHVREYSVNEFQSLLLCSFESVEAHGVYGKQNVMEYYRANVASVDKLAQYDIFGLRNWLPRWLLRIPYDILNRRNRRKLLSQNNDLTSHIKMEDYRIATAADNCFDLIYIAKKGVYGHTEVRSRTPN